ncbi:hypothetical protein J8L88_18035 [Aquimarina sp. MMG015]|uniref:hypothetical protein n=1 Tax=Aquimarina TaxID=290174 RepID=UPI0003FDA5A2|nr:MULTISPECIES: hypothetical protein [Aquimarina]MBQ4804768.1 hypothetical protein [Aquimarina sp. MMG015]
MKKRCQNVFKTIVFADFLTYCKVTDSVSTKKHNYQLNRNHLIKFVAVLRKEMYGIIW